jgi:hypothetical protein
MKFKKLSILMGVGLMTYLSTLGQTNLVQTQAALTAPVSFDYSFTYDGSAGFYKYLTSFGSTNSQFQRTVDGIYFDYTEDGRLLYLSEDETQILTVSTIFNRSNTSWTSYSLPVGTRYRPTDTKVGSDNTVGNTEIKYILEFDNQTDDDYLLYLDLSSSSNTQYADYYINGYNNIVPVMVKASLIQLFIPSYSNVEIKYKVSYSGSLATYIDAWYLDNLGLSDAYQQGYDLGEIDGYQDGLNNNPNILLSGFQAMVGILINMALMVLNLTVFDVSLLSIFSIMALFVGVIWILKLVRG